MTDDTQSKELQQIASIFKQWRSTLMLNKMDSEQWWSLNKAFDDLELLANQSAPVGKKAAMDHLIEQDADLIDAPTLTDVDTIVNGLTQAQRDAMCGRFSWKSQMEEHEGEAELYRLGLWNPEPKRNESILTPLGSKVRHIIKKAN